MSFEIAERLPQFDTLALTALRQDSKDVSKWHATPLLKSLRANRALFITKGGEAWNRYEEPRIQKSKAALEYTTKEGAKYSRIKANLIVALERRMGRGLKPDEVASLDNVTEAIEDLAIRSRLSPKGGKEHTPDKDHKPWADLDVDHALFTEVCLTRMGVADRKSVPQIKDAFQRIQDGEIPPASYSPDRSAAIPPAIYSPDRMDVLEQAKKHEAQDDPQAREILGWLKKGTRVILIDEKGKAEEQAQFQTENIEINHNMHKLERVNLPKHGITGFRIPEVSGSNLSDCQDSLSILIFEGSDGKRTRIAFGADGVGESALGNFAATIMTNAALDFAARLISAPSSVASKDVGKLLSQAAAYAELYLHQIPKESLVLAFEQNLKSVADSPQLIEGIMTNLHLKIKNRTIAATTFGAIAITDKPKDPKNNTIECFFLEPGDGGATLDGGKRHPDNCYLGRETAGILAGHEEKRPPTINYDNREMIGESGFAKLVTRKEFHVKHRNRNTDMVNFRATFRTDGPDKIKNQGVAKPRTPAEMLEYTIDLGPKRDVVPKVLQDIKDSVHKGVSLPDDILFLNITS